MITASCASTSAVLARVGSVVVLLSRASYNSSTLAGHVFSLGTSNASASIGAIRLEEVLPPTSIAVVTSVVKSCYPLKLIPVPLPNPIVRIQVVANVWWHLLSFYIRVSWLIAIRVSI